MALVYCLFYFAMTVPAKRYFLILLGEVQKYQLRKTMFLSNKSFNYITSLKSSSLKEAK
jgi:hypothetical protein